MNVKSPGPLENIFQHGRWMVVGLIVSLVLIALSGSGEVVLAGPRHPLAPIDQYRDLTILGVDLDDQTGDDGRVRYRTKVTGVRSFHRRVEQRLAGYLPSDGAQAIAPTIPPTNTIAVTATPPETNCGCPLRLGNNEDRLRAIPVPGQTLSGKHTSHHLSSPDGPPRT